MTIRGDTGQQAKALARAIAQFWPSATQSEKRTLEKMLKENQAMEYVVLEGNALGDFLKKHKGRDYLIRRDDWGKQHIVFIAASEKKPRSYEASAIRKLRKRQLEAPKAQPQKRMRRERQTQDSPANIFQPIMPKTEDESISIQIKKEIVPFVVGLQKDLAEMQEEIDRLKEEQ